MWVAPCWILKEVSLIRNNDWTVSVIARIWYMAVSCVPVACWNHQWDAFRHFKLPILHFSRLWSVGTGSLLFPWKCGVIRKWNSLSLTTLFHFLKLLPIRCSSVRVWRCSWHFTSHQALQAVLGAEKWESGGSGVGPRLDEVRKQRQSASDSLGEEPVMPTLFLRYFLHLKGNLVHGAAQAEWSQDWCRYHSCRPTLPAAPLPKPWGCLACECRSFSSQAAGLRWPLLLSFLNVFDHYVLKGLLQEQDSLRTADRASGSFSKSLLQLWRVGGKRCWGFFYSSEASSQHLWGFGEAVSPCGRGFTVIDLLTSAGNSLLAELISSSSHPTLNVYKKLRENMLWFFPPV